MSLSTRNILIYLLHIVLLTSSTTSCFWVVYAFRIHITIICEHLHGMYLCCKKCFLISYILENRHKCTEIQNASSKSTLSSLLEYPDEPFWESDPIMSSNILTTTLKTYDSICDQYFISHCNWMVGWKVLIWKYFSIVQCPRSKATTTSYDTEYDGLFVKWVSILKYGGFSFCAYQIMFYPQKHFLYNLCCVICILYVINYQGKWKAMCLNIAGYFFIKIS